MSLKDPENRKIAGLILLGAAIGAALGLLFAPDKGSETRRKLKDGLKDLTRGNDKNDFADPEKERPV